MNLEHLKDLRCGRDTAVELAASRCAQAIEGFGNGDPVLSVAAALVIVTEHAEKLYRDERRREVLVEQLVAIRGHGRLTLREMHDIEERELGEACRGWVRRMPLGLVTYERDGWTATKRLKAMSDDEIRAAVKSDAS